MFNTEKSQRITKSRFQVLYWCNIAMNQNPNYIIRYGKIATDTKIATSSSILTKHRNEQSRNFIARYWTIATKSSSRNLQLYIDKISQRTKIATPLFDIKNGDEPQNSDFKFSIDKISQRTKKRNSGPDIKNHNEHLKSQPQVLFGQNIAMNKKNRNEQKNRNHQLDIENYRNEPNSRNSKLNTNTASQWTKKNRNH